ncbi:MAG: riboflavin synthase [Verrucomicrobiota bacterium JB023]|nr:riboflavin synthase [Verrucomicrobiota bacterium JB023]
MFTGLVEATGTVLALEELGEQARLQLRIPFASELALGDSVAVNGCCLTVAALNDEAVSFDVLTQTLRVTSLGQLVAGSVVNLERALRVGDRLGGHFVQGHVDGTGTISCYRTEGQDHLLKVTLPDAIRQLCIDKGSLTIDGISLTIAELQGDEATFWITPHTHQATNLVEGAPGKPVNLESDMLAKYVAKLLPKAG